MPDIPNPNVTIPLTIIIICGLIAWVAYGHAQRKQEQLRAEREERRNRNRPLEPRPQQYSVTPGSTQALPAVHPNGAPAYAASDTAAYAANGSPAYAANGSSAYAPNGTPAYAANGSPAYAANGSPAYAANGTPAYAANGTYGEPSYNDDAYRNPAYGEIPSGNPAYGDAAYGAAAYGAAPPQYSPPPAYDAQAAYAAAPAYSAPGAQAGPPGYEPPNGSYQLPSLAYEPPAAITPYESAVSNFPSPESWAPHTSAPPNRDISELAPTLPPSIGYPPPSDPSPAQQYADQYAADTPGSYLPSSGELEDWNRQYAPAVEEWILNHEEALDAVTVRHVPVDALDRTIAARKVELTSHLDYAAHAHPSRQQGAELAEMLNSADGTLAAMQMRDFARAEQNHARYLSYRDIWLPRVQRALAP